VSYTITVGYPLRAIAAKTSTLARNSAGRSKYLPPQGCAAGATLLAHGFRLNHGPYRPDRPADSVQELDREPERIGLPNAEQASTDDLDTETSEQLLSRSSER
jgi:hypothetical protein